MKIPVLLSLIVLITVLSSCENEDAQQMTISSAQSCLDKATDSTSANACVAQLGSLRTPDAYYIICSAHFISAGFTTPRFVNAYNSLTNSNKGQNPTAAALAVMAFSSTTGNDGSVQTLSDCQASNVQSLTQLAVLAQMATVVGTVAQSLGATFDPTSGYTDAELTNALQNFSTSPAADPATLGATAVTADSAYCSAGSSFATNSICTDLNAAITGGASNIDIGNALIAQLQKSQ